MSNRLKAIVIAVVLVLISVTTVYAATNITKNIEVIYRDIKPREDISTSIVMTEQNLYIVNSKNELLVCGVADKYSENTYTDNRTKNSLQTTLTKVMDNVAAVSAHCNSSHVFALKLDGSLWGWGFNNMSSHVNAGMLGLGEDVKYVDAPTKVMDNIVSISTGNYHTLALKNDGSLWTWGDLRNGEYSFTPMKIMDNVIFATTGGKFSYDSLVIKEDHSLWVSGSYNVFPYDLSDEKTLDAYKPKGLTRVMENVKYAVSLYGANFAVKQDGSLWSWGKDETGELGNGGKYDQGPGGESWSSGTDETHRIYTLYKYQRSPLKILDNVERIIPTGDGTVYAFTTDGQLWIWGDSSAAEAYLINKKFDIIKPLELEKTVPRKITENIVYISTYSGSFVILKKDGSVWVKGNNEFGQLGSGNTTNVDIYTKILSGGIAGQLEFKVVQAIPNNSPIHVNERNVSLGAYTISGYNYIKLRDIASSLNGTEKQFDVVWDGDANAINIIRNKAYTATGREPLPLITDTAKNAVSTSSKVLIDGKEASLTAYTIEGNNYFKLRDIAGVVDCRVFYDGKTGAVTIDTTMHYTE